MLQSHFILIHESLSLYMTFQQRQSTTSTVARSLALLNGCLQVLAL